MKANGILNEIREVFAEDDLTPRFMKLLVAITVAFLVAFGAIAYVVVFIFAGY